MAKISRFSIAKNDITNFFDEQDIRVFSTNDISQILNHNREDWRLAIRTTTNKFIKLLMDSSKLKRIVFQFPHNKIIRYTWGDIPILDLLTTLKHNMYFTHYTALHIHGLTEQIPKKIYINSEQTVKPSHKTKMFQETITRAFSRPQRESSNIATFNDFQICLINGKYTKMLGVTKIASKSNIKLPVTNLERTLIDIVVRPSYSGGIHEILKAYKNAKDKVSINKLTSILKKLNYIYPYYQAIGFCLEKSGVYNDSQIDLLRKEDFVYNFYLTNQMKNPKYSKKWKLFYPNGI